jgi:hypothetical protein
MSRDLNLRSRKMLYPKMLVSWMALVAMASCGDAGASQTSEEEASALTGWYEEEKLAYEVYGELGARWDAPPFANIQSSEATHMERVDGLLTKRDLANPAKEAGAGVFPTLAFATLHTELMTRGDASLEEALRVGLYIEEKDIEDLELMRQDVTAQDIEQTIDNQLNASTKHLQAFASALRAQGIEPQPQLLPSARFAQLLAASSYEP